MSAYAPVSGAGGWNVFYDTADERRKPYCCELMPHQEALGVLARFRAARYLGRDGKGRTYPNGKGRYDIKNARIEEVA
jgi:hypothetical protein